MSQESRLLEIADVNDELFIKKVKEKLEDAMQSLVGSLTLLNKHFRGTERARSDERLQDFIDRKLCLPVYLERMGMSEALSPARAEWFGESE